jgi:hypothetical protein
VNYYLVAELVVPVASGAPQFNFQDDPSPLLGVSLGPAAFSDRCLSVVVVHPYAETKLSSSPQHLRQYLDHEFK